MKKSLVLGISFALVYFSSCDFNTSKKLVELSPYIENKTDVFTIESPRSWEVDSVQTVIRPFAAMSQNEQQFVIVATVLHNDRSVEEFADERVAAYEEQYRGFKLIDITSEENTVFLRYETSDEEVGYHQYTIMRIDKHDSHFYGTDCTYESNLEKDTAEYILKSMKFN